MWYFPPTQRTFLSFHAPVTWCQFRPSSVNSPRRTFLSASGASGTTRDDDAAHAELQALLLLGTVNVFKYMARLFPISGTDVGGGSMSMKGASELAATW